MHVYTQLCFISVQNYLREPRVLFTRARFKLAADLQSAVSTSASPLPFPVGSSNKMLRGKAWHQVSLKTRDEMQKPAPMFLGFWPRRQLGLLQNKFTWKTLLRATRPKTKQWWVAIGIAQSNTLFTALRVRISSRAPEARRRRTQLNAPRCGENTILALQTRRFSTLLNAPRCGENTILALQARRFSTLLNAPRCGVAPILANQLIFKKPFDS